MRVVAVDPGGTTGVASWDDRNPMPSTVQFDNKPMLYAWLETWSAEQAHYVVEDFRPRPGVRTWVPDSLHIIGYIEGRVPFWHYASTFKLQTPAAAKAFATDDKLRRLGWWVPGQDHARDALRHLLVWLCTTEAGRNNGGSALIEELAGAS